MLTHLCIPHPPITLTAGQLTKSRHVSRFQLLWTTDHPSSHYGAGVLLDTEGGVFDGMTFTHLRDTVNAYIETSDLKRCRGALGLSHLELGIVEKG